QQFAYGAHPTVPQVINVVYRADVFPQLEQVTDGSVKILRLQRAIVQLGRILVLEQLDVELQPAHAREVILARVEEHPMEKRRRRIQRRRIAGAQLAVDLDQRFLRSLHRVALQGLADHGAHIVALGEEQAKLNHAGMENLRPLVRGKLRVGLEQDLTRGGVYHIAGNPCAFQINNVDFNLADLGFLNIFQRRRVDLPSRMRDLLTRLRLDAVGQLHA